MNYHKYLMVRRAYNQIRQNTDSPQRMTFHEFSVLCHLIDVGVTISISKLAEHQQALRPTMTYRTKKLRSLGYVSSMSGESDRRTILCEVTETGKMRTEELCQLCSDLTKHGTAPMRVPADRMRRYVDAMGRVDCDAGDLVLLAIKILEESSRGTVADIVDLIGLMQPTVSMTVATLEKKGLVERHKVNKNSRGAQIVLTAGGRERVSMLMELIAEVIIPRKKSIPVCA